MGGSKGKPLAAIEKQQKIQELRAKGEWGKKAPPPKKIVRSAIMPNIDNELLSKIRGMKFLTPSTLASQLNVKVSIAKEMLKQLEERGFIAQAVESAKIYVPTLAD